MKREILRDGHNVEIAGNVVSVVGIMHLVSDRVSCYLAALATAPAPSGDEKMFVLIFNVKIILC